MTLIRAPSRRRLEQVAAELVRAEDVVRASNGGSGRLPFARTACEVLDLVRPRREDRPEDPAEQQQR